MTRYHYIGRWMNACNDKLREIREANPDKLLYIKMDAINDESMECFLMNKANEPILTIGEWNPIETGVVYNVTLPIKS